MEENVPPVEEIGQGPHGKSSNHSTVAASTDDEFDVPALDDDIEKAAEQVVDEWSNRLKDSKVFAEGGQPEDAEIESAEAKVGTMNDTLPAGGYDEVVMGFDEGNPIEAQDEPDDSQDGGDDDEMFEEEEVVEDSFSEEIIEDSEMLMDDGEIEEILSQAANIAEENGSEDEEADMQGEMESGEDPSGNGSVLSRSSAFHTQNELISEPPELPQRQRSEDSAEVVDESAIEKLEAGADDVQEDDDKLLEQSLDGSANMGVVQDIEGIHETKQLAKPVDTEEDLQQQASSDDIESGMSVAPDIPESVPTGERPKDWEGGVDDDDDDDDGFLCCILVVACLCFVLVVLSIVLPLVFLRKRGDAPTLSPTPIPTQSPIMPPSTQAPIEPTSSPTSILLTWTQNISSIMGAENSDFGSALALDGNFYVVGSPKHNGTGAVFTAYFDGIWRLAIDPLLVGETEGELFGASLDIHNGQLIVGAPSRLVNNTRTAAGVAYVFVFDNDLKLWTKVGDTIKSDEGLLDSNGEFGAAVAIGSNGGVPRIAVGAPRASRSMDELEVGRVYSYEVGPTMTVIFDENVPMFGKSTSDLFGYSIDMTSDGQHLIIGAPGEIASPGYVQFFQWDGNGWILELELQGSSGENFGTSVACLSSRDDLFAVGAPNHKTGSGRVIVYRRTRSGRYEQLGPDIIGNDRDMIGMKGSVNGGLDEDGNVLLIVAASSGDVKTYRHEESTNSWIQDAVVLKTGHENVQVEYSEEDGLLVADPVDVKATLFGPDGSAVSSSVETFSGPVPSLNLSPSATQVPVQENPSNWVLSKNDFSPILSASLGESISMTTSLMVVGAPSASENGDVLIFEKVDGQWVGSASSEISGAVVGGNFGAAVDTTGRFLIVGAPNTILPGTDTEIGAVYCYTANGGEWNQFGGTLRGDTGVFGTNEAFGSAVGTSNNGRVIIGAPSSSVELLSERGRFYVYEYSTSASAWTLDVDVEGMAAGDQLGYSVAMSSNGERFIVGAPGGNYVHSYGYDGNDWTIESTLTADADEAFGYSVSFLSEIGDVFAVGSPSYDGGRGKVVVYQRTGTGGFSQLGAAILGSDAEAIGTTLAGNSLTPTVLVGTKSGIVKKYVFDKSRNEWELESMVDTGFSDGILALGVSYESNELAATSKGSLAIFQQQ